MSVSRTQQLLALVGVLAAFAGQSGAASPNTSSADSGAQWLVADQNPDGRWAAAEELKALHTAEVVEALRATRQPAPTRPLSPLTWLKNRGLANVDSHSCRAVALAATAPSIARGTSFPFAAAPAVQTRAATISIDICTLAHPVLARDCQQRSAPNRALLASLLPCIDEPEC